MRSLEHTRPRPGLSVPVVTALSARGELIEADQRALVRFVIQSGWGADIVFANGTTGEWDRVGPETGRRVVAICAEEVKKASTELAEGERVECWAGVTAATRAETLASASAAIAAGADALVIAPLAIRDVSDAVQFVARDVGDLLDASPRRVPVYLYDNAAIAADPHRTHIRTKQVKALSRLDFVRGIKVSAPRKVLGNYTQAARQFRERGEFGIYVGDAMTIFDVFRPRAGIAGVLSDYWQRFWLSGGLPIGVVSGPANALPREWAHAWQACRAGDAERMAAAERVLSEFRAATKAGGASRTIACLKRALLAQGVLTSDAVASGTPALGAEDAARFDAAFARVRALAREVLEPTWVTHERSA
ncbi:MAG: dihydrodipicolinate synthase family protein [Deltaproteobacteria bacterium]|nr:dihydrodipicolinate synthase family protein [Deltaproteobacteria bacterium]